MKKKINLKEYFEAMELNFNEIFIKIFHFNMIQVNTVICYDKSNNGVIIDPGMSSEVEEQMLFNFITKKSINIKYIINTHPHIDHIVGNSFCVQAFNAPLVVHKSGLDIYNNAAKDGILFGFPIQDYPPPDIFVQDEDLLTFGNQSWKILYTPGHADGSICVYDDINKFAIVGDVLFAGSIGRTDLPSGNFNVLIKNINEKLLCLEDEVLLIPGHAETTTIGKEKMYNPYL